MTINIITLGCSKNIVDSEVMAAQLHRNGHELYYESAQKSDVVIINTCSFIHDAREESVNEILQQIERKKRRQIKKLYVVGCLVQRNMAELQEALPEVDGFFTFAELPKLLESPDFQLLNTADRMLSTPHHYAYLKISEGCDHQCSYCSIPLIRDRQVSKPIPLLVDEAQRLADQGVKELMLIAQDLTYYGIDRSGKRELADLMDKLAQVNGIQWIRLHYAYPLNFPDILQSMRRGGSSAYIYDLIARIRETIPGIALRTTLIAGYPTETREQHKELVEFVRRNRFERLGVFAYSQEEDTPAFDLGDPIKASEKNKRVNEIMKLQEKISYEINQTRVGTTMKVLIDSEEPDCYIGRTEFDSPDVDNDVFIDKSQPLTVGEFYNVEITDAAEYDLFGTVGV